MSTPEPLDPAAIMAAHVQDPRHPEFCDICVKAHGFHWGNVEWPCLPYRLAEALAAEHAARVAAEEDRDDLLDEITEGRAQRDALQERIDRALVACEPLPTVAEQMADPPSRRFDLVRRALTGADQPKPEGCYKCGGHSKHDEACR